MFMKKITLFNIMFILFIAGYSFASHNCSEQLFVDSSSQYANYDTQEQYILLINTSNIDFKEWQVGLNDAGINARHWFPPEAAIMAVRPEDEFVWNDQKPAKQYYDLSTEELSELSNSSEILRIAVYAFTGLIDAHHEPADVQHVHSLYQDKSDALIPPVTEPILGYCSATDLKR